MIIDPLTLEVNPDRHLLCQSNEVGIPPIILRILNFTGFFGSFFPQGNELGD